MFIEFEQGIVNAEQVRMAFLKEARDTEDKSIVTYYSIVLIFPESPQGSYHWYFKGDEKELAEKEFNKIKQRLLGKDN